MLLLIITITTTTDEIRLVSLPLKVMHDKGPKQQILPCAGGFVGGEHQQQREEKSRHLLEEPGQWSWDHLRLRCGLHVTPVRELNCPMIDQVCKPCQDEAQTQIVDQISVTVHLRSGRSSVAAK